MSILYFALGGLVGVVGWLQVKDLAKLNLNTKDKAALLMSTVIYSLLAVVSILGFVGAIIRSRNCIALYRTVLSLHLGFSIATGIFFIVSLFNKDRENTSVTSCSNAAINTFQSLAPVTVNSDATRDACESSYKVFRGVAIGVFIVVWLVELWGCIICSDYVEQLEEEQESRDYKTTAPAVTTYNVNNYASQQGYPFSQPGHAHGPSAPHNV